MEKKFISVDDLELAYLEKNPDNINTIFFIHGNSSSSNIWYKQLNSDVLSHYRLIAIDLPAHGDSSRSNDADKNKYSLPWLGDKTVKGVIELSKNSPYIIVGLSLGSNVVAEMLTSDIHPAGITIIGSCIIGANCTIDRVIKPDADLHAGFAESVSEEELKIYWEHAALSSDENDWQIFKKDYYAVKDYFRPAMFTSVTESNYSDEIAVLKQSNIQLLVIFGEEERAVNKNYLDRESLKLWRNKIFKISQAGHFVNVDQPVVFNKLLLEYAEDIFKSNDTLP